jgi:hypothetical protein
MSEKYKHLIKRNEASPLGSVPFHDGVPCIERLVAPDFPLHLAVHRISDAKDMPRWYVKPHRHKFSEINILIGKKGALRYRIQLGDESYEVESPASIWIPAGLEHATTVIEGSGHYICLILADTKQAFK